MDMRVCKEYLDRMFGGVVKRLGVSGAVRLGLSYLVGVVVRLFIDLLYYFPLRRAAMLRAVLEGVPERLLDMVYRYVCFG